MPSSKRKPIDYKPQFSDDIFRPKGVIDEELAELEDHAPKAEAAESTPAAQPPADRTNERPVGRTNDRSNTRVRVRHSFDVFQDQLRDLADIQADLFRKTD